MNFSLKIIDFFIEYQLEKLLAGISYSVALWMFSRFWFDNFSKKSKLVQKPNLVHPSVSTERFRNEQLMKDNQRLETEIEQQKVNCEHLKAENEQMKTDLIKWKRFGNQESEKLKSLKAQNDILFEALNKANKQQEIVLEKEEVPFMTQKPEIVATTDEFETMVQVMKGHPLIQKTQNKAVNAIQKTQGTELYNKLIDRIGGAKERVEEALNDTEQSNYVETQVDLTNFDIRNYV